MRAVILAAGRGTRLRGQYKGPKGLLEISNKPVIQHVLEKIQEVGSCIEDIIIVTNEESYPKYKEWAMKCRVPGLKIICIDRTYGKEGAVVSLAYAVEKENIDDDLLVLASDNLFNFSLNDMFAFFKRKRASVIAVTCIPKERELSRFGVVQVDKNYKIIGFEEKPRIPKAHYVSTACYMLSETDIKKIKKYLQSGEDPDKLGGFIRWLIGCSPVYAFIFNEIWFDIGTPDELERARRVYEQSGNVGLIS